MFDYFIHCLPVMLKIKEEMQHKKQNNCLIADYKVITEF